MTTDPAAVAALHPFTEAMSLLDDALRVQRFPCDHKGIGKPGCAVCDPRTYTSERAALRAAAQAVVEHFADGDGHDVAYRDGEWVCTDDCRAHALLAALRAALGDEHD